MFPAAGARSASPEWGTGLHDPLPFVPKRPQVWSWQRRWAVCAASCVFFLGVYFLFFRSLQWFFERSAPPAVLTVRWLDVFPELAPVMRELAVCAAEIRERFPLVSAPDVYACDAEGGPFGPACAAEAAGHLRAIEEPSERVIAAYRRRDQEIGRAHV